MTKFRRLQPWQIVLNQVANYIEDHGHIKEALFDREYYNTSPSFYDGPVCLFGGFNMIDHKTPLWRDFKKVTKTAIEKLARYMKKSDPDFNTLTDNLVDWNNRPSRTPHQIIKALREAAQQ